MGALKYYDTVSGTWKYVENPNYVSSSISEEMTGTINGTNAIFTVSSPFAAIDVYKNGVHMRPGSGNDYTITGSNQITFTSGAIPKTGDSLSASYSTPNSGLIVGSNSIITKQTPTGLVNGSNTSFTTAQAYVPGSLQVYVNGLAQSGFITETTPASGVFALDTAPLTGDDVKVSYQFSGSVSGNADTVDGFHASNTPTAGQIPVLNSRAQTGEWYEELARGSLSSAGAALTVSFTPKKYMKVLFSYTGSGGVVATTLRFNGDTASNYSFRYTDNGAANSTLTGVSNGYPDVAGSSAGLTQGELNFTNVATQEKVVRMQIENVGTAGAGNTPVYRTALTKWSNTSSQVSSVTLGAATNLLAAGSELIILGHD